MTDTKDERPGYHVYRDENGYWIPVADIDRGPGWALDDVREGWSSKDEAIDAIERHRTTALADMRPDFGTILRERDVALRERDAAAEVSDSVAEAALIFREERDEARTQRDAALAEVERLRKIATLEAEEFDLAWKRVETERKDHAAECERLRARIAELEDECGHAYAKGVDDARKAKLHDKA